MPVLEFVEPSLKETAGWLLLRQAEGALVRGAGFCCSAEAAAEVGVCGMCEVIIQEIAALEDSVDEREARRWIVAHGDGHGAVQFDHGRRIGACQHVVQADDLCPVRSRGVGRFSMNGRDRCLQRERAEAA